MVYDRAPAVVGLGNTRCVVAGMLPTHWTVGALLEIDAKLVGISIFP